MNTFITRICLLIATWAGFGLPAYAADPPKNEKEKIESLISHVESLAGATFVRNGSDYDAKVAARFLRGKWSSNDEEIKTAADFIEKAATGSSTSGKPYVIRFKDGKEVPCGEYLKAELKKLEQSTSAQP